MLAKLKIVLDALTGYAGSSESPEKVSLRFMGIALGIVSQFMPIIDILHLPIDVMQFVNAAQPFVLLVAVIMYVYGAIKATWNALKASPTFGRFLVK